MSDHQTTAELLSALRSFEHGKIVKAHEAVQLVRDGDTLGTSGFVGIGFAENLAVALEQRFVDSAKDDPGGIGHPRDLTLVYAAGQGDGKDRGLNHFGHPGMARRIVGGHWGLVPRLRALAVAGQVEAYNPAGRSRTCCATSRPARRATCRASGWAPSSTRAWRRQDQRAHHRGPGWLLTLGGGSSWLTNPDRRRLRARDQR